MIEPRNTILQGDALTRLRELPDESVHCCVTSPPYWGLRDYGVEGQLGLEPSPEEYVAKIIEVFREVRRVLRRDGTLWLNLGDCYNAYNGGAGPSSSLSQTQSSARPQLPSGYGLRHKGLKPKDLVGIPWHVAFALREDGWYLRSDIVWAKPNPMLESVTDRPTRAHDYVFLLARSRRYYYDAEAVKRPASSETLSHQRKRTPKQNAAPPGSRGGSGLNPEVRYNPAMANLRSVWTIHSPPYPGAHFATFPESLVEPCVKAGSSEGGACSECGTPWMRVVESSPIPAEIRAEFEAARTRTAADHGRTDGFVARGKPSFVRIHRTIGWRPSCSHISGESVPCLVLDPFLGSGTTAAVAKRLGRDYVGIELNPAYIELAKRRIAAAQPPLTRWLMEAESI